MLADIEAERALITAMFLDRGAALVALEHVKPSDFDDAVNRQMFEVMIAMVVDRIPLDVATVATRLLDIGRLAFVGGKAAVAAYGDGYVQAKNIAHYAKTIRDKAVARRFVALARRLVEQAEHALDSAAFCAEARAELFCSLEDEAPSDMMTLAQGAQRSFERYDQLAQDEGLPWFECGIIALDSARLLRRRKLHVMAGRPSMGKSVLAQAIALGLAENGSRVLVLSLEMSDDEIHDRWVASRAFVDTRDLESPKYLMQTPAWHRVHRTITDFTENKGRNDIVTWIGSRVHLDALRARVQRVHMQKPLDVLVVDYMQMLTGVGDNRVQEVSSISRALKQLASELNIAVLALCQLNRNVEHRSTPIPMLADLRDSGTIEQDADVVTLIFRPHYYDTKADPSEMQVIIAKQRNASTGLVKLRFEAKHQRVVDWGERDEAAA